MAKRKPIQWLTKEKVRAAAGESDEAALACSAKHWWQVSHATADHLRRAFRRWDVDLGIEFCALCRRYPCESCPVGRLYGGCKNKAFGYRDARQARDEWLYGEGTFAAFQQAALKVWRNLKSLGPD